MITELLFKFLRKKTFTIFSVLSRTLERIGVSFLRTTISLSLTEVFKNIFLVKFFVHLLLSL